ncbi:Polysaccharide biosynthesis protein [Bacillus sp. THAF10]|uniref:oligosaccharide flippase family protein n=1 Tax=Bacillus sp. THAF10 TaxID=2587848 RepID=UPI00126941B7|nr:lipopolysaccharide biosynthesis protein [Bacillus sp. THAF10]QFT90672.1 Polysaccharide biosynthesis protein [Bacillus sp. THAF10]
MMSKHAFAYFLSHGVPALVSFASIAIFTRMLSPEEYGMYALVFAIAGMINAVVFEWLKLSLLRYYPRYKEDIRFFETIKLSFLGLVAATLVVGVVTMFFFQGKDFSPVFILLTLLFSWTQSWNSLNLTLMRAKLSPKSYGMLAFSRTTLGLVLGTAFIYAGFAEIGLLVGLMVAFWITLLRPTLKYWKLGINVQAFQKEYMQQFLKYGMPLTITLLLSVVIHNSDRLIIDYLLNTSATGIYSVTYDLSEQTIFTLMMVINLAAYPIAVKVMEDKGELAAYEQVKKNTSLIFLVAIPAVTGFVLISANVANLFLGESFREDALTLIPYIAIGALLKGFKLYCVDIMFHLKQKTALQIYPVIGAALLNIGLNFWLIPQYGIEGAAMATVAAYAVAVIISWIIVHIQIHSLPFPVIDFIKVMIASIIMGLALWPLQDNIGVLALILQLASGGIAFVLAAILLNLMNARNIVWKKWKKQTGR